ncbi:MAG: nodulation protein NfeD [Candidatus Duberdicusella sinuisediminis]|nr:MAG: nodulation protein NfeD [Candidatus Omnitrophota bacterium]
MKRLVFLFFFLLNFSSLSFSQEIRILTIKDYIINPVIEEYIRENIKSAEENSSYLLIRLNTPGGLLKSTQNIVKEILNAKIPVITYIWPKGARAASAGTFIGCASSILAMAPSTHIGAAHPVLGGGSWGKLSIELQEKIMNDTLAWAKNIAKERNRPYNFLEEAIKKSKSLTEEEALKRRIIDLIAEDLDELLKKVEGKKIKLDNEEIILSLKNVKTKFVELNPRQKFLNTLLEPNIAYLLFTLGFLGLIFEFTHPGFGFPGIAGVICLVLALYAFSILPVNYAGLALIILGLIFFIVEALTPTFGVFTLSGLVSFILGSILLFREPQIFQVSLKVIAPLGLAIAVWGLFILGKVLQARLKKPQTGKEALIGEVGQALTDIYNIGKVFIHGEVWQAKSKEKIEKGEEVEVVGTKGLVLEVKKKGG